MPRKIIAVAAAAGVGYYGYKNYPEYFEFLNKFNAPKKPVNPHGGLKFDEFTPFTLKESHDYNHNTKVLKFALKDSNDVTDLPVTSHVLAKYNGEDGKPVIRPYTPIHEDETGVLTLAIKKYPNSKMGTHAFNLQPGETLELKGYTSAFKYAANKFAEYDFVAAGTGITPIIQLTNAILHNKEDKSKIKLLYANTSEKDILFKEDLDNLAAKYPGQFEVKYIIDKASTPDWKGETGYINKDLVSSYIGSPAESKIVCVCGPPGLVKAVSGSKGPNYTQGEVDGILKDLGYNKDHVFKF